MTVAAIVLAAGSSRRMGERSKLTAEIDGRPIIARAIAALRAGGASPIIAVVGHRAAEVRAAIDGAVDRRFDPPGLAAPSGRVEIVDNPDHLAGVGTSIAAGIRALGVRAPAAMIALGDMPSIDPSTVAALIDAHRETPGLAVAPERGGRRGHPVLFPRAAFADLAALSGDRGARAVFAACPNRAIAVDDPGIFIDIDTPEDLP